MTMPPEAMATIHAAAFTHDRPWSVDELRGLLSGPGIFITSLGRGFAMGRAIAGEAELLTIAVAPDAQGKGLGRRLLVAFEAEARFMDATIAFLEVAADNAPANALYTRAGYRPTGRRKGYYARTGASAVDAILMSRQIGDPQPAAN